MTIRVEVAPVLEKRLADRAHQNGTDVPGYVGGLIERDLDIKAKLDEILGPFRKQVAESGVTDEELDQLFDGARLKVNGARASR